MLLLAAPSAPTPSQASAFSLFLRQDGRRRFRVAAVNRKDWTPGSSSWVCSRHFLLGKPCPHSDCHPDFGPCVELSDSPEANAVSRENAEKKLERFNRTMQQLRNVEKRSELPVDHSSYTRPMSEAPTHCPPQTRAERTMANRQNKLHCMQGCAHEFFLPTNMAAGTRVDHVRARCKGVIR